MHTYSCCTSIRLTRLARLARLPETTGPARTQVRRAAPPVVSAKINFAILMRPASSVLLVF